MTDVHQQPPSSSMHQRARRLSKSGSGADGRRGASPVRGTESFSLEAIPFQQSPAGAKPARLLTERQHLHLASIASRIQLPARSVIYSEESAAGWIYIVGSGVVKAFRHLPMGRRYIAAFVFRSDVFGLAENGLYVNTTQTVTAVTLYRLKTEVLADSLRRDADLQMKFVVKLTHELREAQRRAIVLSRRDAAGRVAMFLSMLEKHTPCALARSTVDLPMSRSDIADYLGLTLEAVSRATRKLEQQGIVGFDVPHTAHILDRRRFEHLVKTF